jgi:hypothetical protein
MLNAIVKPPHQLLQDSVIAVEHHTNLPGSAGWAQCNQGLHQAAYLHNIQFVWSPAGDLWQAQPQTKLCMYRQFIRILLCPRHMVLAECVQMNTFSLSVKRYPINLDFWIHIRSGVIQ